MATARTSAVRRHAGEGRGGGRVPDLAAVPARLHPDEPARDRRSRTITTGSGRSALLSDRRRQDRGVPRPGGVHARLSPAASNPGLRLGRVERADALHAAAADARPAQPRGHLDLCPGAGAAQTTRIRSGPGRSRSACGSAGRRRRTGWAARATTTRTRRVSKTIAFQNDDRKPAPIPLENCPWCGDEVQARVVPARPQREPPERPAHRLHEPTLRLHPRSAAADPGRGRADLSPPALLPDRHGRQVRRHALDGPGRRVVRPGGPLRRARLLRPLRSGPGTPACPRRSRRPT